MSEKVLTPTLEDLRESLTPLQFLFVENYLGAARFNGTKAARLAGYEGGDNVLAVTAYDNLRIPKIAAYISARLDQAAMPANEVLARLSDMASASLEDFMNLMGSAGMLDLSKATKAGKMHLVKKYKYDRATGMEIELHDSQAALIQLGRHHGLFKDKIEQTGEGLDVLRRFLGVDETEESGDAADEATADGDGKES